MIITINLIVSRNFGTAKTEIGPSLHPYNDGTIVTVNI